MRPAAGVPQLKQEMLVLIISCLLASSSMALRTVESSMDDLLRRISPEEEQTAMLLEDVISYGLNQSQYLIEVNSVNITT